MTHSWLTRLALPAVVALIAFLSYGSQILFIYIEPGPLRQRQAFSFNAAVVGTWICYLRACFTDPGRVPSEWKPGAVVADQQELARKPRWCRKCKAFKPPRAHHCKTCQRCIPKMDHHCPWTGNCVSYRTFPHFIRFLFYAVGSMTQLEYFLYVRVAVVWQGRDLPSYLGPSPLQLIFLFIYSVVNTTTLFALAILVVRNIWCLGANVTTIEGWEIERHETLLRRARVSGGSLDGPNGIKVKIVRQEFPYDIGIFKNVSQAMGGNPLLWLWPFARSLFIGEGLQFEINGFEDPSTSWPPPDPDRIPRLMKSAEPNSAFAHGQDQLSVRDQMEAFRQRQVADLRRFQKDATPIVRRLPFYDRYEGISQQAERRSQQLDSTDGISYGEEGWRDPEGDRLDDFGVDELVEFYDEDDLPLATILQQQKKQETLTTEAKQKFTPSSILF